MTLREKQINIMVTIGAPKHHIQNIISRLVLKGAQVEKFPPAIVTYFTPWIQLKSSKSFQPYRRDYNYF